MRSKALLIFMMILGLARALSAGLVTLNDGTSLSGDLKEQENGDVIVVTGAGEVKVAKDKIRSIVKDSNAAAPQADMSYVNKVKARREKYGNEDGIPRTKMLNQTQIAFNLGYLSYVGNALGSSTDFNGMYFGMSVSNSFNDLVGWEAWGGYGFGQHDYGAGTGFSWNVTAQRWDISFLPRLQKAISLGSAEDQIMFIPHFGIGPIYSNVTVGDPLSSFNSGALGGVFSVGADFQFGPALVGLKYRYIMSYLLSDTFTNRDATASLVQVNVGWAF